MHHIYIVTQHKYSAGSHATECSFDHYWSDRYGRATTGALTVDLLYASHLHSNKT